MRSVNLNFLFFSTEPKMSFFYGLFIGFLFIFLKNFATLCVNTLCKSVVKKSKCVSSGLYFLLSFFLIAFSSCKKAEDRSCFKSTGKQISKEIKVNSFYKIKVYEHLDFVLVQDSLDKIIINGGENLLNYIDVVVENKTLSIRNKNKCAFLRTHAKKIKVEIHFTNLEVIDFYGSEMLTNIDTLNLPNLNLTLLDCSGSVNLCLISNLLLANVANGYGDFTLKGNVNYADIQVKGNGFCDTYGLEVKDSMSVISNTVVDLKVNVDQIDLKAETKNKGNINYIGIPFIEVFNKYGDGKLIDKN